MENKEEVCTALEGSDITCYMELKYKLIVLALCIVLCEICCRVLPVTEWRGTRSFGRLSQSSRCYRRYRVCSRIFVLI